MILNHILNIHHIRIEHLIQAGGRHLRPVIFDSERQATHPILT